MIIVVVDDYFRVIAPVSRVEVIVLVLLYCIQRP